jgi:hypothetical protein
MQHWWTQYFHLMVLTLSEADRTTWLPRRKRRQNTRGSITSADPTHCLSKRDGIQTKKFSVRSRVHHVDRLHYDYTLLKFVNWHNHSSCYVTFSQKNAQKINNQIELTRAWDSVAAERRGKAWLGLPRDPLHKGVRFQADQSIDFMALWVSFLRSQGMTNAAITSLAQQDLLQIVTNAARTSLASKIFLKL